MQYRYGLKWHDSARHPVEEMTEEQARAQFPRGPQVAVIAGDPMTDGEVPTYTMMMSADGEDVDVEHYAATGSIEAILGWSTVDGRLFLSDLTEYLYPDDGKYHFQDECLAVREYQFRQDGTVTLRSDVTETGQVSTEQYDDVDVSGHWHDPLEWGSFDALGTFDGTRPG